MKIYQIHEYGGQWEDAYDYIVGSYLHQEKALEELERFRAEDVERSKCQECPANYCPSDCDDDCENCRGGERAAEYCVDYEPRSFGSTICVNYDYHEPSFYKIEEVEVVE